jgi:hypothetical protein
MKRKRLFIFSTVLVIAVFAALNAGVRTNKSELSDVSLDNVEALANESDPPNCIPVRGLCHTNGITYQNISFE